MANFICEFVGVRGRSIQLYDTKIIITTKKTVGSLITGNFTDGEKTIYLCDIVGVQFKKSDKLIGYLQFETPSMQMNNKNDNFFSENTFTYEKGKNGITNELMETVYKYVTDRIEEIKYDVKIIEQVPDFDAMKVYTNENTDSEEVEAESEDEYNQKCEKIVLIVGRDIPEDKHTFIATNPEGGMIHLFSSKGEALDIIYVKNERKIKLKTGVTVKLFGCVVEGYSFEADN